METYAKTEAMLAAIKSTQKDTYALIEVKTKSTKVKHLGLHWFRVTSIQVIEPGDGLRWWPASFRSSIIPVQCTRTYSEPGAYSYKNIL